VLNPTGLTAGELASGYDFMTLIGSNGWKPLAQHLTELLCSGQSLGDAVRIVSARPDSRIIFLLKAVQIACNVSSREAAKIVAKEVTSISP